MDLTIQTLNCVMLSKTLKPEQFIRVRDAFQRQSSRFPNSFWLFLKQTVFGALCCDIFGHYHSNHFFVLVGRYISSENGVVQGIEGEQCIRCREIYPYHEHE